MPAERVKAFIDCNKEVHGKCGEEVFLNYFGYQCYYKGDLNLPEIETYTVVIIDVWETTRTKVFTGVSGNSQYNYAEKGLSQN